MPNKFNISLLWSAQGPDTKNYEWEDWGEWSDCAGDCGSSGVRSRHRVCIPPLFGGYECPALVDSETEVCVTLPCLRKCCLNIFYLYIWHT